MNAEQFKAMLVKLQNEKKATDKQVNYINELIKERKAPAEIEVIKEATNNDLGQLPMPVASRLIEKLQSCKQRVFAKYPDGTLVELD